MPYAISIITLPGGSRCVRAEGSGVISKEDADNLMALVGRSKPMFGVPILVPGEKIKSYSSEARNIFGGGFDATDSMAWCAVTTTSPLLRVVLNFMTRVSGHRKVKVLASEEEAIRWLDEHAREDAAKSKAP